MRQLDSISLRGIDMRPLDRQAPAGLCADIVNLRPKGPRENPYWVPVRGATGAINTGVDMFAGKATAKVQITTMPKLRDAVIRLVIDGTSYSAPFMGATMNSGWAAMVVALNQIIAQNNLPLQPLSMVTTQTLTFAAKSAGTSLNGKTVTITGSTGGTFTTGIFTGGVSVNPGSGGPVNFGVSQASFYFETKRGQRKILSLNNGALSVMDTDELLQTLNLGSVSLEGYVPGAQTVMSCAQLDDILAVALSEDDVPKALQYLYDGQLIDMAPPELPSVRCEVYKIPSGEKAHGLQSGWYGVRMGWRLTDGRVINLTPPSIVQIKDEDTEELKYTYHFNFTVSEIPSLAGWSKLISGIAVFLTPRSDTLMVDDDGKADEDGDSGPSVIGSFAGGTLIFNGYKILEIRSKEPAELITVYFQRFIAATGLSVQELDGMVGVTDQADSVIVQIPTSRIGTIGTRTASAAAVSSKINQLSSLVESLPGVNINYLDGGFDRQFPRATVVLRGAPIDPNNPGGPGETDYQSMLFGKEHAIAGALFYDCGSIPFSTGSLMFRDTEEVLTSYPVSEEDNVVNQHKVRAAVATVFNKQLVLGNTAIDFAAPRPNRFTVAFSSGGSGVTVGGGQDHDEDAVQVRYAVKIMANGREYYRQGPTVSATTYGGKLRDSIIAYPDRRATEIVVTVDGSSRRLRMTASSRNNFAYVVLTGLDVTQQGIDGDFGDVDFAAAEHTPNRVLVSETFNPHVFLAKRVIYGDNHFDAIRGFGVNTLPVSGAQFGTYPMHVLCRNSIWSLEQGSDPDVAFARKAPLSQTHGLVHQYAVCNVGQTVVFASYNGVYTLSGSRIEHISAPVDPAILQIPEKIRLGHLSQGDQREIWIGIEGGTFVYSLEYGLWYRLDRERKHFFTDGRRLLSVDVDGAIVDEGAGAEGDLNWAFRTRPLHWGAPDMLKRVFRVALRHDFALPVTKELYTDGEPLPVHVGEEDHFALRRGSVHSVSLAAEGRGNTANYVQQIDIESESRYTHRFRR